MDMLKMLVSQRSNERNTGDHDENKGAYMGWKGEKGLPRSQFCARFSVNHRAPFTLACVCACMHAYASVAKEEVPEDIGQLWNMP